MERVLFSIVTILALVCGCASEGDFNGASGLEVKRKVEIPPPTDQPENHPEPLTDDLVPEDQETLAACQQKSAGLLKGVKMVDVQNIGESLFNKENFVDAYAGSEKRVLIINFNSEIANKVTLRLTNSNTTYCLNMKSQIVNKLDIGLTPGARLLEARDVSLLNKSNVHQI